MSIWYHCLHLAENYVQDGERNEWKVTLEALYLSGVAGLEYEWFI